MEHRIFFQLHLKNVIGVAELLVRNVCRLGQILFQSKAEWILNQETLYNLIVFCSESCSDSFWKEVKSFPLEEIGTEINEFGINLRHLFYYAVLNALKGNTHLRADAINKINWAIAHETKAYPAIPMGLHDDGTLESNCWDVLKDFAKLGYSALAFNLERCGRPLDAAVIYEKQLKMYDKAKSLREKEKQVISRHTDVSINLNELLRQVRDGGIVAIYRCPHCNGTLKINNKTSLKSLKTCEHCGSEIETVDLADFLKTALS